MNKMKIIVDAAQLLLKVAEDLRSLSDSVQAVCKLVTEGLSVRSQKVCKHPFANVQLHG